MKRSRIDHFVEPPGEFAALSRLHPLRPINDQVDLDNATEVLDRLAVINRPTKDQADYLQTLSLLVEQYENANFPISDPPLDALDLLRYLMRQHDMTQTQLADVLGVGASSVSMILSGTRSMTIQHARALAKRFAVGPELFI